MWGGMAASRMPASDLGSLISGWSADGPGVHAGGCHRPVRGHRGRRAEYRRHERDRVDAGVQQRAAAQCRVPEPVLGQKRHRESEVGPHHIHPPQRAGGQHLTHDV